MKLWIMLVVLVMLVASCKDLIKDKEICIVASTGRLGCDDPRLEKSKRSYVRELRAKDICTNERDYFEAEEEIRGLIKDNIKLKSDLKKCMNRLQN